MGGAPSTSEPCAAHKSHRPTPTYQEQHHVIPREWQRFFAPAVAPFPGVWHGEKLWDARMVNLCRTGHGNVHFWIEALMHALAAAPTLDPLGISKVVRAEAQVRPVKAEFDIAWQALLRFEHVGGDLQALIAAGLWGQI